MNGHSEPRATAVPAGGLLELVEAETRLAAAVAAAEDDARALVQAARDEVAGLATRVETEIEAAAAALAKRIAAETPDENRRIAAASEDRCRRHRDLPGQRIEQFATEMEGQVLRGDATEARR